jgi:signal recognition particle subunit SRP72
MNGIENNIPHAKGDTFELDYNVGCVLVGKGQFAEAESILLDAEKECVQTLEEDGVPEEEIEDEVSIIRVQRGYCAQKLGRTKEAMHIYTKSLKVKPSDIGLAAVAANNILSLNRDQNIFDSKKRIRTINAEGVENRITRKQLCYMRVNQCLFSLHTNQYDACLKLCAELLESNPEAKEEVTLIKAAVVAKTEGIEAAKKLIEKTISEDPQAALRVRLGLVQQVLRGGKRAEAIDLLRNLGKDKYLPGVVSSIVTLYQADGDRDAAAKLIREAIQYYRQNQIGKENMSVLWQQAVALMMEQGDYSEAVKSLEEQYKLQHDNMGILAQLVIAYAKLDLSKAEQLSKRLPNPSFESLDVATLESPSWQVNLKLAKKSQKGESVPTSPVKHVEPDAAGDKDKQIKKKKKKKKRHIPANLDPNVTPDPERWLPKYERSGFKPRKTRSKGKVDVGKGTQGATSEAAAQFDMSAKVRSPNPPDNPAGDGPAVSAAGYRKDANKKKKKKR